MNTRIHNSFTDEQCHSGSTRSPIGVGLPHIGTISLMPIDAGRNKWAAVNGRPFVFARTENRLGASAGLDARQAKRSGRSRKDNARSGA